MAVAVADVDPNDFNARGLAIKQAITELPVIRKELDDKQYAGTILEIMQVRVLDVRQVRDHAVNIRLDAEQLSIDAKLPSKDLDQLLRYIDSQITPDPNAIEIQDRNAGFVSAVLEMVSDPNNYSDPTDPNYPGEIEHANNFLLSVLELCEPI